MFLKQFHPQKVVFDVSFDSTMSKKVMRSISTQLMTAFIDNRDSKSPFDMHICNFTADAKLPQDLLRTMPTLRQSPLECHEECASELYPKETIVYLSQCSPYLLNEYNPDDVYVIGALVEKNQFQNVAFSRAKQLGVRSAWFPRARNVDYDTQGLSLNAVVNVLREWKSTRDWDQAYKCLPKRKLVASRGPRNLSIVPESFIIN